MREVALLGGDSGAEGDDEEALSQLSRDTNSPLHIQAGNILLKIHKKN